jgi:hypothetical protein
LVGDVDATQKILEESADHKPSNECQSNGSPNNVYGYGNINLLKAVELAMAYKKSK